MRRASRRKANACNLRVVFPGATASERDVCHCFGVLAEAVLVTLRRAKMTLPGHCLSQSGQAVAHPGWASTSGLRRDARLNRLRPHIAIVSFLAARSAATAAAWMLQGERERSRAMQLRLSESYSRRESILADGTSHDLAEHHPTALPARPAALRTCSGRQPGRAAGARLS